MHNILMVAGAAALLAASPAIAGPKGKGANKANKPVAAMKANKAWSGANCPPGLRDKGCMPPGQAKKLFDVGQRIPSGYSYTPWGTLPGDLRDRYDLDDDYRYIYRDNRVYVVDPATSLVTRIIDAIL